MGGFDRLDPDLRLRIWLRPGGIHELVGRTMTCETCDGNGVLYVLHWAYARADDKSPDWHDDAAYPTWCHGCPAGTVRREAGML